MGKLLSFFIIVFWGTFCPPCKLEIPHLIELRNKISKDELQILAIAAEDESKLKSFVAQEKINYTVITIESLRSLPAPFAYVKVIPMSFFVDKQGNFKLIAEGLMTLTDSQAILKAEN